MEASSEAVSLEGPVAAHAGKAYQGGMDQVLRLLMRMAYWVRRPPSRARIIVMAAVVAIALACVLVEAVWGWPSWLTVGRTPRNLGFRPL